MGNAQLRTSMKNDNKNNTINCPCGSPKTLADCCLPYIEQLKEAPTAEALMRSRYSAFVLNNESYLRFSWHPDTCPKNIHLHEETKWLGLSIKSTENGQEMDNTGCVVFVARYKNNGKAVRLHENSRFTRHEGRWVYLDGESDD